MTFEHKRKIIDPNIPFNDTSVENEYYMFPKIGKNEQQITHSDKKMKVPINKNTERLSSLLYNNLEESMDYYNDRIKEEKFITHYSGGVLGSKKNPTS